mgnify:CR=1 FL=1
MLGLTLEQLFIIGGVGVALVVLLFVLRAALRATKVVLRFGCLGIVIILAVLFFVLRGVGG